ncbi:hypothetical protein [Streptomyces morookaense]|uniref:hypothetical protein n=1 Tax=Streptomyces morookaense TaxID=1970 RepID=UPI0019B785E7|nr:hypothetical protein GCM10010359_09590 [Streptomyces morookaense]
MENTPKAETATEAAGLAPGTPALDTRTGRLGIVMGTEGPYVQLRPQGGGREWDCPPARVRPVGTTKRCVECSALKAEHAEAVAAGDLSRATDCTVLMGRHQREAHT